MRYWQLVADVAPEPLLNRLDPDLRLLVILSLAGILLLGIVLIALAAWGGWFVRREARRRVRSIDRGQSDWDRKQPLEESGGGDEKPQ